MTRRHAGAGRNLLVNCRALSFRQGWWGGRPNPPRGPREVTVALRSASTRVNKTSITITSRFFCIATGRSPFPGFVSVRASLSWSAVVELRYRVASDRERDGCGVWNAARRLFRSGPSAPSRVTGGPLPHLRQTIQRAQHKEWGPPHLGGPQPTNHKASGNNITTEIIAQMTMPREALSAASVQAVRLEMESSRCREIKSG
jgi:hypothetical protein